MKKIIFFIILIPSIAFSWSELPIWSGWDGSEYWTSEMDPNEPAKPTNDQCVSSWDIKIRDSEGVNHLFMLGRVVSVGGVWKDGKINHYGIYIYGPWMPEEERERVKKIVNDIATTVYERFKEPVIGMGYYPQFKAFTLYLHPDKKHDNERYKEVAEYLESMREQKYKEFWN